MNGSSSGGAKRDILLVMGTAAITVALTASTRLVISKEAAEVSEAIAAREPKSRSAPPEGRGQPSGEPCSPGALPREERERAGDGAEKVERVRLELQALKEQRTKLQEDLRTIEKELREREAPPPYEYDLSPEQWKELAARGRIKYRAPCQMSPESGWKIGAAALDDLGLSPDDGETVMAAFHRSNKRLWTTVRPMCVELAGQERVVDMLGFDGCKTLIEQSHEKEGPLPPHDVRRIVAEVRAGMREPLSRDAPGFNLYQMYMALTGEGGAFEADLAESFGPETAERIWHAFPCSISMRF
jgi:hypothetical protein